MAGHRNLIKILFFRCFQGEFARGLPGFSPLLLCLVPLYFFTLSAFHYLLHIRCNIRDGCIIPHHHHQLGISCRSN
ncbi:hypothetical protein ERO13_A11G043800v2 [Gossypium hirsutum]|uniref:Uncharacterized protein n=2 Tax=Gossypium TaxID=3633 RepID=A0A5D2X2M1_GOSMU|nr:hypothetical protein ERO13_A11G043800v2 [Gossypium hirsutum]TYH99237.1 hypothetical protein ES332_A11G052800v1 [Gossypium tomentosum]TYJ08097.1 hypothetical protein E1A91_A11G051100v1 [Gossypium mustelinum]KAG4173195.1 hypothetical protein ERO13_A11G043800v2 [Gossypium hirsutum]KAG4173196.1 hypothetical protein ERO13_A11G043800v2 [Gossypium hirsutum]